MNTALHFSSANDAWSTPQSFFDTVAEAYAFTLDVCALPESAKCSRYFTPEIDGLTQTWAPEVCWMNPPYGRQIGRWVKKAYDESRRGATVVCLLPARTDTRWFHAYCLHGDVVFLKGRLKFGGSKNSAPFPSILVTFRPPVSPP